VFIIAFTQEGSAMTKQTLESLYLQELRRINQAFTPPVGCCEGDSAANEIEIEDRLHEAVMANAEEFGCCNQSVANTCNIGNDECHCRRGLVRAMAIINR
jgi:hypothetical protein